MKHLLNNLTEEEKNRIRGQHKDSIKVVTENFSKLLNAKSGEFKPLVSEQEEPESEVGSAVARYVVKPGDNLTKIAKMVNSTVEDIMKNNPEIKDPNKLDIGQEIVIESKPTDNQFSELIGKTATFKNDALDIIVKGEIMKVLTGDKTKHRDGVLIVFKYLAVTKILSGDYTTNADMSNAMFDCNKQIFHIRVLPAGNKNPVYLEFTCKGLSDVLIQMSPCKTDFAMTDTNIPNDLA